MSHQESLSPEVQLHNPDILFVTLHTSHYSFLFNGGASHHPTKLYSKVTQNTIREKYIVIKIPAINDGDENNMPKKANKNRLDLTGLRDRNNLLSRINEYKAAIIINGITMTTAAANRSSTFSLFLYATTKGNQKQINESNEYMLNLIIRSICDFEPDSETLYSSAITGFSTLIKNSFLLRIHYS